MEAVDDEAERRVIGVLHDVPGLAPSVDVPAPGEGLVADAQPAFRGALGHLGEVGGGARGVVDGGGLDVAADQDEIGAERLHDVELALGAVEIAGAQRIGRRLEIAEGLEDRDGEAEPVGDRAHVGGGAGEGQQVVLEDLDGVEADGGGRLELFRQGAAERDGGDRFRQRGDWIRHGPLLRVREPSPGRVGTRAISR